MYSWSYPLVFIYVSLIGLSFGDPTLGGPYRNGVVRQVISSDIVCCKQGFANNLSPYERGHRELVT